MNYKDKLGEATVLLEEIKAFGEEPSAEDMAKVPEMMENYRGLKSQAMQYRDIQNAADELKSIAGLMQAEDPKPNGSQFKSWGDFLYATWQHAAQKVLDPRLKGFKDDAPSSETKQMAEAVGATGGFLVPVEFLAELQSVMAETAIVRGRATVIPMRRRQLNIPVLDQTGTAAGQPHWFGGMQFYWLAEATSKTITTPNFRQKTLVAHKLIGYTRASDELLDDSAISLQAFLAGPMGFAGGAVWMEDFAFLQGTGVGQPTGVINAPATIVVPRQTAGTITFVDVVNMLANFLPGGQGMWVISQSAMAAILQQSGPAGNPSYVWIPNARDGVPGNLFGMPVVWTEKLMTMGTQGDILLADWRYYLIGDRQATTVESTKFDRWQFDQTSWRMVHRVDGQPWLSQPLTLQDSTTQISPFVILGDVAT
jgi:HK97 family phage major capsid protein